MVTVEVVEAALDQNADFLKEPVFRVGISAIENDGYKVLINAWSKAHGFQDTKMKFQEVLVDAFKKAELKK